MSLVFHLTGAFQLSIGGFFMNVVIPTVNWTVIGPELILTLTAMRSCRNRTHRFTWCMVTVLT